MTFSEISQKTIDKTFLLILYLLFKKIILKINIKKNNKEGVLNQ